MSNAMGHERPCHQQGYEAGQSTMAKLCAEFLGSKTKSYAHISLCMCISLFYPYYIHVYIYKVTLYI